MTIRIDIEFAVVQKLILFCLSGVCKCSFFCRGREKIEEATDKKARKLIKLTSFSHAKYFWQTRMQ